MSAPPSHGQSGSRKSLSSDFISKRIPARWSWRQHRRAARCVLGSTQSTPSPPEVLLTGGLCQDDLSHPNCRVQQACSPDQQREPENTAPTDNV
ncbi:hypothetical protein CesoFtcFv8_019557 [Champsocephalus esox]|uniref:Uncharacterized protein n=1 Tax=Champsocephalus esox TaxID=159716 RepID=A0AAN8BEU5_9TELE|nr:hypothetical protein CesoFtcFv8_019557 [Champsocephalus esox]